MEVENNILMEILTEIKKKMNCYKSKETIYTPISLTIHLIIHICMYMFHNHIMSMKNNKSFIPGKQLFYFSS